MTLPRLYAIIDVSCFTAPVATAALVEYARELALGGATLIQYRNKDGGAREMLSHARELRRVLGDNVTLIMNDRADLCIAAACGGVHVGQDDVSPEAARGIVGSERMLGVSTHNLEQLKQADSGPADYVAFGPVFATASKQNPDAVVGLEVLQAARAATAKPLVAIGGITRAHARSVLDAGADSVAVIADLLSSPKASAQEFFRLLA
jgi:thiamine-phosphate pyrophosphorylase